MKESDDEATPETQAIHITKEHLQIEVEITQKIGKNRPEGKLDIKKTRPVLIKFLSHKSKEKVMKAKRQFKGSNYWITEHLTSVNLDKYIEVPKRIKEKQENRNVWTTDGKIQVRRSNDSIVTITWLPTMKNALDF